MRIAHAAVLLAYACAYSVEAAPVSFQKVIRPLLEDRCAMCHSADAKTSGFEVTSVAALLKGGRQSGRGGYSRQARTRARWSSTSPASANPGCREKCRRSAPLKLAPFGIGSRKALKTIRPPIQNRPQRSSHPLSDSEKLLNEALFSANAEQLMILRRSSAG